MSRHALPRIGVVVGAVDSGDVHAERHKVPYEPVLVGRCGGKSHHDPGHPARRAGSEQGVGVVVQGGSAFLEALDRGPETRFRPFECCTNAFDGGQYVRLASAE